MENESTFKIDDPAEKDETPVYNMHRRGTNSSEAGPNKKSNPYYDAIQEYSEYSTIAGLVSFSHQFDFSFNNQQHYNSTNQSPFLLKKNEPFLDLHFHERSKTCW